MNTNTAAQARTLTDYTGNYGPNGRVGILSEHVEGFRTHTTASGTTWATAANGGRAVRVVCSELVQWNTEDGPTVGRCGQPTIDGTPWCPGHKPDTDLEATCEHGMSAWLCAGPGHYPMDM